MISKTRRAGGGLEDYVGKVIGCHRLSKEEGQDRRNYCERWYPSMWILQVGEEMLLYQFRGDYGDTLLLVHKEPGRLYQEGQRIDGRFHVFLGMQTYQTVAGASRTVPVFKKVEL